MSHPHFDPSDPFAPLPPRAPEPVPAPKGKVRSGPGRGHLILTVASVIGLIVFSPIILKLKAMNDGDEIPITGAMVLQAVGFMLSLVLFAGTLGVRMVHWIAGTFVNLIFNLDGDGWTWEERRRMKREAEEREAKQPRRPGTGFDA